MQEDIRAAAMRLGISMLTPLQQLIITQILESALASHREDIDLPRRFLSLLPTGAGKSLCFQVPAMILPHPSLVIFPLLSLMSDQLRRMSHSGLKVLVLRGGMTEDAQHRVFSSLKGPCMLIANPEILLSLRVAAMLRKCIFSQMVVDEAHCIAEWGERFRPSFLELGKIFQSCRISVLSAFSATASEKSIKAIHAHLFLREEYSLLRGNPDRANIHYSVVPTLCPSASLTTMLHRSIHADTAASDISLPCIVFANNRRTVEHTARKLRHRLSYQEVFFYHAGLSREEKSAVEQWFFASKNGILVATCAYGMGVDKPNIRSVIHMSAPESISAYLQESGRAGRDRNPAYALLLFSPLQILTVDMQHYCCSSSCRRDTLLSHFGSKSELCLGCDICDAHDKDPEGAAEILNLLARYPNCYQSSQLADMLTGISAPESHHHDTKKHPTTGSLRHWYPEEVEEAITSLERIGVLHRRCKLWGSRLSLSKTWKSFRGSKESPKDHP